MSATPPSSLEGSQAPSPFEVLWERYKSLIVTIIAAILLALVGNYFWKVSEQKAIDEKWSKFAASIGISDSYVDFSKIYVPLTQCSDRGHVRSQPQKMGLSSDSRGSPA